MTEMPKSVYAVIVSDAAGERCEGLHDNIGAALDRVRAVTQSDIASRGWVATLIPATCAFDKENDGQMVPL